MTFLGNVIWIVCGGFFSAVAYFFGGLALCLTIIGIPFGVQSIKFAFAILAPFGKDLKTDGGGGMLRLVFNLVWLFLFGWEIALVHLVWGLLLALTVVGLPFAKQHFKLIVLALFPFGRSLE